MRIEIISTRVSFEDLKELAKESFGDMIKAVVDIQLRNIALGGELHADAESKLLENGSLQENLWGINIYINKNKEGRIIYQSFINIRPKQNNRSMLIEDKQLQLKIKEIVDSLVGTYE
jgi:hypothetical protein